MVISSNKKLLLLKFQVCNTITAVGIQKVINFFFKKTLKSQFIKSIKFICWKVK
jgi:hypothetical protein